MHVLRRGNKYSAAHYFRLILANDDRPRTMHAEAERIDRELLPDVVGRLLQRHEDAVAHGAPRGGYRAAARAFHAGYERMAAAAHPDTGIDLDANGLEI